MNISVVIIGLNEANNLDRCFSSVMSLLEKSSSVEDSELIYVDSGSTDNTFEVTNKYEGIRTFLLNGVKSAAAARKVGEEQALFDYILFLDGDMAVNSSFLDRVISSGVCQKKDFAGAIGYRKEMIQCGRGGFEELTENYYNQKGITKLSHIGGALLIKSQILTSCGGFDPFMKMWEEQDLLARINCLGLNIYGIDVPFITHFNKNSSTVIKSLKSYLSMKGTGYYFAKYFYKSIRSCSSLSILKNQTPVFMMIAFVLFSFLADFSLSYFLCFTIIFALCFGMKNSIHAMIRCSWLLLYPLLSLVLLKDKNKFEYESI